MIGNTNLLPPGYAVRTTVDLKSDRKVAASIQIGFVAIAAIMVGLALILGFPLSSGFSTWATIVVTVVACLFYMVIHELTHAGFLWLFTRMRPAVTLRIPYLTVGGRGYLNTRSFLVVALAPVVIWGLILVILLVALPSQFFFAVYIVAILNFAGSSGDYFQGYAIAKLPTLALIQDDGKVTTVYLPTGWPPLAPVRRGRVRKLLRVAGAVGLSVAALVAVSMVSNLVLGAVERANADLYGERVSIDGGKVNVSVTGEGEQAVVLLSGYGTASPVLDFTPLIRDLDDTYTVVVIERFGYGYSDLDVTERTVENVSTELHDTLAKLNLQDYVLVAHSLAGIYSLDYVNRFPGEVSALVTIDGTVPRDFAVAPKIGMGQRLLSVTGWVRWMAALNPAITAPSAPVGVYSEHEIEQIRLMTIWNYANPAMIDENNRSAENFDAVAGLSYPSELPVLAFLSQQLVDTNTQWRPAHEKQLESLERSELVVLDGGHYLHWTHSKEMAESLDRFLG